LIVSYNTSLYSEIETMARMMNSTRGGNVGSLKNASRKAWLDGVRAKAELPMRDAFVAFAERKGGMTADELERWLLQNNIGYVKVSGGYRVQNLNKAVAV
jgi:hypothetical protein